MHYAMADELELECMMHPTGTWQLETPKFIYFLNPASHGELDGERLATTPSVPTVLEQVFEPSPSDFHPQNAHHITRPVHTVTPLRA